MDSLTFLKEYKKTFYILLLIYHCKITDPNYLNKPLSNTTYNGFISRDFFQIIVEIPVFDKEITIMKEREVCLQKSLPARDKLIIPILRKIAAESPKNKSELLVSKKTENYEISRGEFSWFLDSMFLYLEDYSSRDRCKFIYRNIQANLYSMVENTKLVVPEFLPKKAFKMEVPPTGTSTTTPANPSSNVPIVPGVTR